MLIVRYGSEAERKRLENIVEKWSRRMGFEKPGGAVLLVRASEGDMRGFLEDLYSRLPRDRVRVYRVEEASGLEPEPVVLEALVETGLEPREAWGAVELLAAKLRGALIAETSALKAYTVSTRKGVCRVEFAVTPRREGSVITVRVEGYGAAASYVYERVVSELRYLGRVVEKGGSR